MSIERVDNTGKRFFVCEEENLVEVLAYIDSIAYMLCRSAEVDVEVELTTLGEIRKQLKIKRKPNT